MRLAAWLGLFAMLMAFAGPLYSQLRALDSLSLALAIDLKTLHCAQGDPQASPALHEPGVPEWVQSLDQCGYCNLLASSPALPPTLQLVLPAPSSNAHQYLPSRQSLPQAPPAARHPRGPPFFHA